MSAATIPFVDLAGQHDEHRAELIDAVSRVLDHGQFIFGEEVEAFEERFAQYSGTRYALGLNSGLDALILGLRTLGIQEGDEVITPPNSYIASSGAIGLLGARPVFADVGQDMNIDPSAIERAVTNKTKAIMPVHLTGRPCEMDAINQIASQHDIPVIEDAAQSITARYRNKPTGSLGDIGCFSLHPLKTLNACGDAGVVTTDDPDIYERLRRLRNHGLKNRDECVEWGYNSRLDSIQAALLLVKFDHVEAMTARRRANASLYQERLAGIGDLLLPVDQEHEFAAYHTFIIRSQKRDALQEHLRIDRIGSGVHYPIPIHLQPAAAYLGYKTGDMPETEKQASQILSLPVHQGLDREQIERVIESIKQYFDAA